MALRQVKDLLQWVADFHATLGAQYDKLSAQYSDERMKMALSFLAQREEHMQRSLTQFIEDAQSSVLNVWLQDSQNFVHPKLLERIPQCVGCDDPQDILANSLTAHRTLSDMYRLRAELSQVPGEQELFEDLARHQEAEARLQARDFGRLAMY